MDDQRLTGLLARIAGQDQRAMAELHDLSRPALMRFLSRLLRDRWTAEDVLQDVYRQIWFQSASYTRDRGKPANWIFMIARSRAFDHLRHGLTDRSRPMLEGEETRLAGPYDENAYVNLRHRAQIRHTLTALPEAQRRMIHLAFYEGYSHAEIAVETGLPLGTVKTRIRNGLSRMRASLTESAA
jgi:RNA polymerase sigma-70 factor (ECF subfamily)